MDQKISDLDIKIAMEATDIIPVVDSNGDNKAINGAQVKDFVGLEVDQDIDAVKDMISDEYDNTATYEVGDYCIYNNTLYKCSTAISTPEDFDPDHWDNTSIVGAINELNTGKQENLSKGSLSSGDDLDNISTSGFYWVVAGVLNRPVSQYGVLEVCKVSSSIYLQRYTVSSSGSEDGSVYQRQHTSNGWKNWVKISV